MKTFTGYLLIFISIPLFIILVHISNKELTKVQSFHEVLDDRIHIENSNLSQTSYIVDREKEIISELHRPLNRIFLSTEKIPSFLKELVILAEDQHFYNHLGFDMSAMARALAINIQANGIEQGGSTITQQLARNLYLNHERSYNRKLSELLYAYELERTHTKDEILDLYINTIYFQNGAYGIEAASQLYFQKNTASLTKAQLAFLAAIPNNPSYYDPVQHFKRAKDRQERLLQLMTKKGYMHHEEAEKLINEKIEISLKTRVDLFPDYTTFVEKELKELIAKNEGFDKKLDSADEKKKQGIEEKLTNKLDEVIGSGIIIHTALQPSLQNRAKEAVNKYLPYSDVEGSAVVIDHKKHEIVAMIGGKDYKKFDFNRAFQGYRQPGSSIKPLLVYAPYLEQTKAPLTEMVNANSFCEESYCPQNYGGGTYGMVSLEKAFMYSYNTPAVRLLNNIGIKNGFNDLSPFNFKKVLDQDRILPAAVGGFTYGMTSLELTGAYTVFANDGMYQTPRAIRKVTDLNGKTLYTWKDTPTQVWSKPTIDKMRVLLNKAVMTGTARRAYYPSNSYIGGKTGTTNAYHDFWFIGLNDQLTAGVWVGKDIPANIKYIESSSPQLLIWREIVTEELE